MKQKDIALFIAVGLLSAVISVIVSNYFFTPKSIKTQKAEVVERISTDFKQPDPKFFNKDANNPTKRIQIGENTNTTPFNGNR